jgi:hypothetical protein
MKLKKLTKKEDFANLKKGDDLIVNWNPEGEMWSKEMQGKKVYKILYLQKASTRSKYPDEIILRKKENIFFNYRLFLNGESKIVKEVFLIQND